jgi:hypothetical protein
VVGSIGLLNAYSRNQNSDSKEKAIVCMTKKDLLIRGWVGVGQLLVAFRQTVQQSINNHVFVVKSFKMANFTNGING